MTTAQPAAIPFVPDPDVRYGEALTVSPLVRRVVARNPSAFTYTGSGTYIVGHGTVAVIDPGPNLPEHVEAILAATAGETISAILITHTHRDHSPAAAPLSARTGAPVIGCAPIVIDDDGPRADEAFDTTYAPARVLQDGEAVSGPGWTLTAVHTPGHTSNHLCYELVEEQALFTGDHVMGWSTTVIAPPDGDMADYRASLSKLIGRSDRVYYPTHGQPVVKPQAFARALLAHRRQREAQILTCIDDGLTAIPDMVARMYANVAKALHGAAGRSVLAHLIDLEQRGLVVRAEANWLRLRDA
jgi:glyoxylase-like metal-dependent hydrolase (beta-lactamase superfamily II)